MADTVTLAKRRSHATIADVARHAGVSQATVSRVLNASAPVTDEVAQRVRSVIVDLSYQPRVSARTLASGKLSALGLIARTMSIPFMAPLLQGIEWSARQFGYDVLIHASSGALSSAAGEHRALGPHNTDGLLVFSSVLDDREVAELHSRGFPIVMLFRTHCGDVDVPCVTFDSETSTRKLVSHLIEAHNCRRIALLTGPSDNEEFGLREAVYRTTLADHGLPLNPALVQDSGRKGMHAAEHVERWLAAGLAFDAIFAVDDDTALQAIAALQKHGKRVPNDIPVVGFDDIHLAYSWAPGLTTVHAPVEEAGREAVSKLVQLIETGSAARLTVLPTEVVIRQSCGCL